MRIIIIGANGQLGNDLCRSLQHFEILPLAHRDIEITDIGSVSAACSRYKADVIINTAAFVRVDDCETYQDKAFLVNALGARNVAVVAQNLGAKLVYISTDYVFDGRTQHPPVPYKEFNTPAPLNVYGSSKLAGEQLVQHACWRHMIVRVSGLFGTAGCSGKGSNFIETMLKLAGERKELRVINDPVFSPTYTKDAAQKIAQLIQTELYGIYHLTNRGSCSWYEFAAEILRLAGSKTPLVPITSAEYPCKASRPGFSVLDNYYLRLLKMDDMRPWQEALADYMTERGASGAR